MNLRVDNAMIKDMWDCLQAYFNSGHATWKEVVKAVADYPINNKRVAKIIAKKYNITFNVSKDEL